MLEFTRVGNVELVAIPHPAGLTLEDRKLVYESLCSLTVELLRGPNWDDDPSDPYVEHSRVVLDQWFVDLTDGRQSPYGEQSQTRMLLIQSLTPTRRCMFWIFVAPVSLDMFNKRVSTLTIESSNYRKLN
jgi:hypothetical protein